MSVVGDEKKQLRTNACKHLLMSRENWQLHKTRNNLHSTFTIQNTASHCIYDKKCTLSG